MFPNLFVIGAAKTATTSLCRTLSSHSAVFLPHEKEPHYFCFDDKGYSPLWIGPGGNSLPLHRTRFCSRFDQYLSLYRHAEPYEYRIDGSTQYLVNAEAAQRISEKFPAARILVSVRGPFERAWSAYWFNVSRGEETRSFVQALQDEMEGREERVRFSGNYVDGSNYGVHVQNWLRFFPDLAIVNSDDLKNDFTGTINAVIDWLNLPCLDRENIEDRRQNVTTVQRNRVLGGLKATMTQVKTRVGWIGRVPFANQLNQYISGLGAKTPEASSQERTTFEHYYKQVARPLPAKNFISSTVVERY